MSDYSQYIKTYHYPEYPADDPILDEFHDLADEYIEIFRWKDTDNYLLRRRGGDFMWSLLTEQWEWPDRETLHAHKDDFLLEGLDQAFAKAAEVAALEREKKQSIIESIRRQRANQ